ncbi:MAG TPA: magnesium transporter CorA family protein [Candidatus Saccharibacteria bacterium]|nr:magnesium transporter CorA family protein [Candidatus Saccharibacteria bacterium]
MLAYYAKRSPGEEFETIARPLQKDMWVDVSNATIDEITDAIQTYHLDMNVVNDVRDANELPRVEFSDGNVYIFLRVPRLSKTGRIVTLPLLCVVTPSIFVSISTGDTIPPEAVSLSTLPISTEQPQTILLGVMAGCVAKFEDLIQHTAETIRDTASRLRSHEVTNKDFIHFVTVEANLHSDKMNLESTLAAIHRLHEHHGDTLTDESLEALDDIALHIGQLLAAIDGHVNSVESIRNAYGTVANNTLNQRMKTLTVLTVLITLPNVVFGMYGMNVVLPFGKEPWVYGGIIGATTILVLLVYIVAKRLKVF